MVYLLSIIMLSIFALSMISLLKEEKSSDIFCRKIYNRKVRFNVCVLKKNHSGLHKTYSGEEFE